MKLIIEVAIALNLALMLGTAYVYLFHRRTYWPALRDLIIFLVKGALPPAEKERT